MADGGGQYVQDNGNGTYTVVVGGNPISTTSDLGAAQSTYNQATGGGGFVPYGGAPSKPNPKPTATSGGAGVPSIFTNQFGSNAGSEWNTENQAYGAGWGGWASGMSPSQFLAQQGGATTPGNTAASAPATGASTGDPWIVTIDGPMKASEARQRLGGLGSQQVAAYAYQITDPAQLASFYNSTATKAQADAAAAQQQQAMQQMSANSAKTQMIQALLPELTTAFGPNILQEVNAVLGQMGLPQIPGQSGPGVNPWNLTPAQWDALPPNVQTQILNAWQSQDKDPKDFLAAIDRQRPQGPAAAPSGTVRLAPVG